MTREAPRPEAGPATPAETVVAALAREIEDGMVIATGVASYLAILAIAVLALGLWPDPLVEVMHPTIDNLLNHIANSKL